MLCPYCNAPIRNRGPVCAECGTPILAVVERSAANFGSVLGGGIWLAQFFLDCVQLAVQTIVWVFEAIF